MNADPSREATGYWYPYRPGLCLPLRIIGILGLWGSIHMWTQMHEWSWANLVVSLGCAAAGFQIPKLCFDRGAHWRAHYFYNFVVYGLLIFWAASILVSQWHR